MQTITVPTKTFEKILSKLDYLSRTVGVINEKLEGAPPYGSDEWWGWSNARALKSIKEGKGIVVRNKKELDRFFNSL